MPNIFSKLLSKTIHGVSTFLHLRVFPRLVCYNLLLIKVKAISKKYQTQVQNII
jgi:hypothetical protein